jgi:hypothetical protein
MIGLPEFGARVRVYPKPGLLVQATEMPVDRWAGGHYLSPDGEDVIWSPFQHEQLRHGAILLHPWTPVAPDSVPSK